MRRPWARLSSRAWSSTPARNRSLRMETRRLVHPEHYSKLGGADLRRHFLVEDLFAEGVVKLVQWEGERTIIGSAVPLSAPLPLVSPEEIKAGHFSDRRELGVANL